MENTTYSLGRVGMRIRGEFDTAAEYEELDVVTYNGNCYVAKQECSDIAPTDETCWMMMAMSMGVNSFEQTSNGWYLKFGGNTGGFMLQAKKVTVPSVTFGNYGGIGYYQVSMGNWNTPFASLLSVVGSVNKTGSGNMPTGVSSCDATATSAGGVRIHQTSARTVAEAHTLMQIGFGTWVAQA